MIIRMTRCQIKSDFIFAQVSALTLNIDAKKDFEVPFFETVVGVGLMVGVGVATDAGVIGSPFFCVTLPD